MGRKEIFAMQDVKILVAIHKPYKLPTEEIYVPILVVGCVDSRANKCFAG